MPSAADDALSMSPPVPESLADAWWTGPFIAQNASILPPGHALVEPYLYDAITDGAFDSNGHHQRVAAEHDPGSSAFLIFGLSERVAVGFLPRFGYDEPADGPNSSSPGIADFGAQVQYGLTSFHEGSWVPATAIVLAETFPTGRYDRLKRPSDGLGAGAYTTAVSWLAQDYLWLPNGRILRVRLNVGYAVSSSVPVQDASVYGTANGFRGHAHPGDGATLDAAAEYSVTRRWVLAGDVLYQHNDSTRVTGRVQGVASASEFLNSQTGSSKYLAAAPALEFNWSSSAGVIGGARIIVAGRNASASVTPVVAVNLVF